MSVFPEQLLLQALGQALSPCPGAQQQPLQQEQGRAVTEPDPAKTTATVSAETQAHRGQEGCGRMGGMWEEEEGCGKDGAPPFFCSTTRPCVKESLSQTRWTMVEDMVSHASLGKLWGLSLLNRPRSLQRTLGVPLPLSLAGL